jgi:hypothetical protein
VSKRPGARAERRKARKGAKMLRQQGVHVPPPGLDGTYDGSCIVCLEGTDTGLAFRGSAEWSTAGLMVLGVPQDQATAIVQEANGSPAGTLPAGLVTTGVRVCRGCVDASGASFPLGVAPDLPVVEPKEGQEDVTVEVTGIRERADGIVAFHGFDADDGEAVSFAVSSESAAPIIEALERGERPTLPIPRWNLLGG